MFFANDLDGMLLQEWRLILKEKAEINQRKAAAVKTAANLLLKNQKESNNSEAVQQVSLKQTNRLKTLLFIICLF